MKQVFEGQVLGKYRVERVLGRGGMAVVVAAVHEQLGQRVAIKLLLPELCANQDAADRFLREARAAVQIQSEHVARVIDVGTFDSGQAYMVMEYLRGSDFSEVLPARGPLPIDAAVDYILQTCEAIAEAHQLGIVHRDLKPANLFLTQRPDRTECVKVLDFGISKALQGTMLSDSASVTASAVIMGSPQYMSPEQTMSSRDVDVRTDVWSLGMILHEMLSGEPMYRADSPTAVIIMISTVPPTPIRALRPDVPPELEKVILKCLERNREHRHENIASFAQALAPFAPEHARRSVERISRIQHVVFGPAISADPEAAPTSQAGATGGPWGNTHRGNHRPRAGKVWLVLLTAVVMAMAGVGISMLVRSGGLAATPAGVSAVAAPPVPPTDEPRLEVAPSPAAPEMMYNPPALIPSFEPPSSLRSRGSPTVPRLDEPVPRRVSPTPTKTKPTGAPAKRKSPARDPFDDPK